MQKRREVIGILFLSCTLLVAPNCGDGRKSKTLSRETALSLLKEKPELLKSSKSEKVVVQFPWGIRRARASEDEIAGRVPLELPNLSTLAEVGIIPGSSPFEDFLMGHFFIHAVKRGMFFRQRSVMNNSGGVNVEYSEILHPDVNWSNRYREEDRVNYWEGYPIRVWLVGARGSFGQVTGIHQTGSDASADVEIVYTPTEGQQRMKEIAAETMKDLGLEPERFTELCKCHFLDIPGKYTRTYRFALYDDGWRVVSE